MNVRNFVLAGSSDVYKKCVEDALQALEIDGTVNLANVPENSDPTSGLGGIMTETVRLACLARNKGGEHDWGIAIHTGVYELAGRWFYGPCVCAVSDNRSINPVWGQDFPVPKEIFSSVRTADDLGRAMETYLGSTTADPYQVFSSGRLNLGVFVTLAVQGALLPEYPVLKVQD